MKAKTPTENVQELTPSEIFRQMMESKSFTEERERRKSMSRLEIVKENHRAFGIPHDEEGNVLQPKRPPRKEQNPTK